MEKKKKRSIRRNGLSTGKSPALSFGLHGLESCRAGRYKANSNQSVGKEQNGSLGVDPPLAARLGLSLPRFNNHVRLQQLYHHYTF